MLKGPQRILLVEDDADDELFAIKAIGKCEIKTTIEVVRDGAEAIDYLFRRNISEVELPELILLDINLPIVSGLEVLKELKQNPQTSQIPVVIMSSSSEHSDVTTAYELGANSYIRKPVDFSDFSTLIERLLEYWLALNFVASRSLDVDLC